MASIYTRAVRRVVRLLTVEHQPMLNHDSGFMKWIPEAREVRLSKKDRKVLETCCRSPVTLQRDLKRARIVLLATAGRSTRSIAKEVRKEA